MILDYRADSKLVYRRCTTDHGIHDCLIRRVATQSKEAPPEEMWLASYLSGALVKDVQEPIRKCTIVDAFSGCGGFALGMQNGLQTAGFQSDILCAIDMEPAPLSVFGANLKPRIALLRNANSLVDFQVKGSGSKSSFQYKPTVLDRDLQKLAEGVDIFIAGPPCQGHSNLNNLTRRSDPRNLLYVTAASLGVALQASVIIIENVPQVVRSSMGVVDTAKWLLRTSGYLVTESTIDAGTHLCAQSRKRHFLFAHKGTTGVAGESILTVISKETRAPKIAVSAVIGDLLKIEASGYMDEPSVLSDENTERIRYLFKKDLYELPNKIRPVCHRNGHTYPSVYGRMRWDEPAQTITSGFLSPGRGRFIHPRLPRALTLHEGARIQGFPDGFVFGVAHESLVSRGLVSQMIADAVPPSLGAVLGLAAAAVLGQATGTGPIPFPSVPCLLKAQKRPRSPKG